MRRLALVLTLALAACRGAPTPPPEPETPEQRACRAEAERSPELGRVYAQANPAMADNRERLEAEARRVRARAFRDCLRARGLPAPGGVEPVTPR
ncbi:phosphoribosylamine--glycine ligase [Siccirubricoccus sp. KC 17139]|uniref:Phosphoribosylamine--glycine ligase n=1 Tax=Siccirubricoccus soli TaxID=2899147 RepID=A0ABT1D3I9_9PROT|nr:phosphoribosylamine--glycine ligase [Siccirubricoccus soli]MCO6416478.1 phosphoribosylamine--glycine ligase [Siccirubricoccus soli]MCP2682612.1 phosphoribosylamine--glycine ligase [Siccirubricoccus soli]